jgi:hypothetical protein
MHQELGSLQQVQLLLIILSLLVAVVVDMVVAEVVVLEVLEWVVGSQ